MMQVTMCYSIITKTTASMYIVQLYTVQPN